MPSQTRLGAAALALGLALFARTCPADPNGAVGSPTDAARALEKAFLGVAEGARSGIVSIRAFMVPQRIEVPVAPDGNKEPVPPLATAPVRADTMGTGFVADAAGWIVTCAQVVEGGRRIEVVDSEGRSIPVREIYYDPVNDVAAVKVDPTGVTLVPLPLASVLAARPGSWVVCASSVPGIPAVMSVGNVLAPAVRVTRGSGPGPRVTRSVLLTSALGLPFGAGAPILNLDGQVVAVALPPDRVADAEMTAGTLGIPAAQVAAVLEQLKLGGAVQRAWIGVGLRDAPRSALAQAGAAEGGAYVSAVSPGSPALAAGVEPGDIIVSVTPAGATAPTPIRSTAGLVDATEWQKPGTEMKLDIVRKGKTITLSVTLATVPKDKLLSGPEGASALPFGVEVEEPTPELLGKYRAEAGALVAAVAEESVGALLGLEKGDLLVAINGEKCESAGWFREKLKGLAPGTVITAEFRRPGPSGVASYLTQGRL